jgi:hypothetical protein
MQMEDVRTDMDVTQQTPAIPSVPPIAQQLDLSFNV